MTLFRPAVVAVPASSVQSDTVLPYDGTGAVGLTERLATLVAEARSASYAHRAGLAGAVNALMARLPAEAAPEASAALLHRLQEEGLLEGLEDEEGLPSSIVATRTLLELGYPHALEISPERLDAMRRWTHPGLTVPWLALALTLFFAFIVQVGLITLTGEDRHDFGIAMDALDWREPPALGWVDTLKSAAWDTAGHVFGGQLLANFLGFLGAVTVGSRAWARPWVRRAFLGMGALGLLVGCVQWVASPWLAWSTLAAAAGSLSCGWLLKK